MVQVNIDVKDILEIYKNELANANHEKLIYKANVEELKKMYIKMSEEYNNLLNNYNGLSAKVDYLTKQLHELDACDSNQE